MDLEEINAIKQQLHEKLREAELELSVRRAKLSQREAVLEEKEARLQQEIQRKMILSSDIDGGPSGNTMLSRLKVHLREFTAAKMGKSNQNRDSNLPRARNTHLKPTRLSRLAVQLSQTSTPDAN